MEDPSPEPAPRQPPAPFLTRPLFYGAAIACALGLGLGAWLEPPAAGIAPTGLRAPAQLLSAPPSAQPAANQAARVVYCPPEVRPSPAEAAEALRPPARAEPPSATRDDATPTEAPYPPDRPPQPPEVDDPAWDDRPPPPEIGEPSYGPPSEARQVWRRRPPPDWDDGPPAGDEG